MPADWYVPEGPTPTNADLPAARLPGRRTVLQLHRVPTGRRHPQHRRHDVADVELPGLRRLLGRRFPDAQGGRGPVPRRQHRPGRQRAAAGYSATLLDGVEKVVLIGHSAGGGLVAGTSGYMRSNGTIDRLAGVVMLDGVGFGKVMPEALAKLPDELPIYNIAGKAYFWNMNGATGAALESERPGKFNGVRLLGGLHSDPMAGGNPLVQFGLYARHRLLEARERQGRRDPERGLDQRHVRRHAPTTALCRVALLRRPGRLL